MLISRNKDGHTEGHWAVISARVKVVNFMGCMKRGRSENQSQEGLSI